MYHGKVMKMRSIELASGDNDREKVELHAVQCGNDWTIIICGGEKEHVGAVALAMGNPIEGYELVHQPSVSQIVVPDHKDNVVATDVAFQIAGRLKCQVCVSVGIHIDEAKAVELVILQKNVEKLIKTFINCIEVDTK